MQNAINRSMTLSLSIQPTEMGSIHLWLLLSISTHFLTLQAISAHSMFSNRHYGPPTHITKHLSFPNFDPISTASQIKLLGSATVKSLNGPDRAIQIPDPSSPTFHAGRAIYADPIRLFDPITKAPASFSTTFSFQIAGGDATGGHGFAFVVVADEFTIGRPGSWLGMLNDACGAHEKFFAVEFDTGLDLELGDPSDDHVGVNLGSVVSCRTANASEARVSLRGGSVLRAWIDYDGGRRRRIEVRLGLDSDPFPAKPILDLDLDVAPFLQEYMFVGFSGSGGDSTQLHNVLSWNFSSSIQGFLRLPSKKICPGNVAHQVSRYSESSSPSNRPNAFTIFVAVIGLVTAASIVLYFNSRSRELSPMELVVKVANRRPVPPIRPRRFKILEISRSTKQFSKTEVLSSDCRGTMYRGTMPNGCFVSVKRFSTQIQIQNRNRVLSKIKAIVKLEHQKLAPIRGWCLENRESIVVYDYYQNGSLEKWLYGVGALPWTLRRKLIADVAESLIFLHSNGLAHGSLSSATVFVDSNHRAVVGDYSFGESGRVESVSGEKSDVFGFGALVVEMVAGKKTAGTDGGEGSIGILEFAWGLHERGEVLKVVDERVGSGLDSEQAIRVLEIGLSCTLEMGRGRPSMEEVGLFLSMRKPIVKLPPSRPAELWP